MGQAKRRTTPIRSKAVGCSIFGRFSSFNKCRSEVAGDFISGEAEVRVDVRATFGESGLNRAEYYLTLWPALARRI